MAVSGVASSASTQGFFSSSGELLSTDQLSASDSSAAADDVAAATAASIASEITEAAVTSISSQLNVAGTGYDNGVSALVSSAVASGLKNQESKSAPESTPHLAIGGSYQNKLIEDAAQDASATDIVA